MDKSVYKKRIVFLNGNLLPEDEASVSVFDRGFLYGDGVFETMRAYAGRIFKLQEHIQRLRASAEYLRIKLPYSDQQLAVFCNQLLEHNEADDAIIRISLTRGRAAGGIGISHETVPTIVAFIRPAMPVPQKSESEGVSAIISTARKTPSCSLNSRIKSMNFLNNILARSEAEEAGAYEAIMLDERGNVTEATASNIFFVRENSLFTPGPENDILLGITRSTVLDLAATLAIPCKETIIAASEIHSFEECFLTNSAIELLPVKSINSRPVGNGRAGRIYQTLHREYTRLIQRIDG